MLSQRSLTRRKLIGDAFATTAALALAGRAPAREAPADDTLLRAVKDVVIANRILADQHVVDAYGHVSARHPRDPERFLISRSRSPELVEIGDIVTLDLDGIEAAGGRHALYLERYIHAAILRARPEMKAVIHAHAMEVLPYTVTDVPLVPVIRNGGTIGEQAPPVWDIAKRFGDTNLLVTNLDQGADLARTMGTGKSAGFATSRPMRLNSGARGNIGRGGPAAPTCSR